MFKESDLNFIDSKDLEEQCKRWNLLQEWSRSIHWSDRDTSLAERHTVSNQALVRLAIEREANADESGRWLEARVLQLRMNGELVEHIYELLDSWEQDARVIGAMIATDINQCAQLDDEQKQQCFEALVDAFDEEPSIYAKTWILCAIGRYCTHQSVDFLLQHIHSEHHAIRMELANLLAFNRPKLDQMRPEVARGILSLASDPSPRVAWNILWDIAEFPQYFSHERQAIIEVAEVQAHHSNEKLRNIARRVVDVLAHFRLEKQRRQFVCFIAQRRKHMKENDKIGV